MGDRIYFRIEPDSPVMDVIIAARDKNTLFREAAEKIKNQLGASDICTIDGKYISGVDFPNNEAPKGWRKNKNHFVPDKRLKIGREIAKKLNDLPRGVDGLTFSGMLYDDVLKQDYTHWGDNQVQWTVYERYGTTYVLSVPFDCHTTPPKCTELKMSEYWALRELKQANKDLPK